MVVVKKLIDREEIYTALVNENFKKVDDKNNTSNKYPYLLFKCEGCKKEHSFVYSELNGAVISESPNKYLYFCIEGYYSILSLKGMLRKSVVVECCFYDSYLPKNIIDILSKFYLSAPIIKD